MERTVVGLGDAVKMAVDSAEEAFRRDSHIIGITTGLKDLDHKLGGLHSSDLLILAGRPSMGKTALATNIAFNAASAFKQTTDEDGRTHTDGGHVLFFSLEMSAEQLAARILSEQAEISSDAIRRGDISSDDFDRLVVASQKLSALPLYIDDTPALSISGLRTRARRLKRQQKLHLIVVDYLQLLQGCAGQTVGKPGAGNLGDYPGIEDACEGTGSSGTGALAAFASGREPGRQAPATVRPSRIRVDRTGSDVVMFIFREEYYLEKAQPLHGLEEAQDKFSNRAQHWAERLEQVRNTASVIIAKQRHGPVGTIDLFFDGKFTRFADLDRQHGEDGFYESTAAHDPADH